MKRAKCCLVASILTMFLSAPAVPRADVAEEIESWLIAQPHPELGGIESLEVAVVRLGAAVDVNDVVWEKLLGKVEQELKQAGLKIADSTGAGGPAIPFETARFEIRIDMLKLDAAGQHIFLVRTSLARSVYPVMRNPASGGFAPGPSLRAEVWAIAGAMQAAAPGHVLSQIGEAAVEQTRAFIVNWTAANPPAKEGADSGAAVVEKTQAKEAVDSATGEYAYVASKNSKVFHTPSCPAAKKISPKNLIGYRTRSEAVNAGKRPCKLCRP